MHTLNSILIEGTLIDDPVASTSDDLEQCRFSIAAGDSAKAVSVIAYHKLAMRCSQLLSSGSAIRVVGRIAQDLEATAATGAFSLHVEAEHIEFVPSKSTRIRSEATADGS
jgi:single-stranded DNA-binding protein